MTATRRIGIQIDHDDPFWVQLREVIWRHARSLPVELIEVVVLHSDSLDPDQQIEVVEGLLVQELDALICNTYPAELIEALLSRGLPIVYLAESDLRRPGFVSREGLFEAGATLGRLVAARLPRGNVLIVGGLSDGIDRGQSRIDGFRAGLGPASELTLAHLPCPWLESRARGPIADWLRANPEVTIDAIFGLSDPLALAAREVCLAMGRLAPDTPVVGVNGDPLAFVAISDGLMTATVETELEDIAAQAVELAYAAARGEPLPAIFAIKQHLITAETVADRAVRKLMSLATLPSRLAGLNRRNEELRLKQLETSVAIDQQVGLILDETKLALAIMALIRDTYGFDHARLLQWHEESGLLFALGEGAASQAAQGEAPEPAGPLAFALARNQVVFIPNTATSNRFPPDPLWPMVRARVIVPVRLGGQVIGLLDLHRPQAAHYNREELDGLQLLADQLGIATRNAQLYGQELEARSVAEKADRLKTTLLANVSHELRTPLNVVLGYSRAGLDGLREGKSSAELAGDLGQVYRSAEHLLRLINDLLDLSRAEIGELDLMPERIEMRGFLEGLLRDAASFSGAGTVTWRSQLPAELPPLVADPVRLRQILLNLLHNAHKFTAKGTITLAAEVVGDELHLSVADTGPGIAPELHEQIFEPFISADPTVRRHEGVGLGLNIARRLTRLHRGRLSLESEPGRGSTFHVYLPLTPHEAPQATFSNQVLLLISEDSSLPEPIVRLADRRGLALQLLRSNENLASALQSIRPALLAWDITTAAEDGWRVIEEIRGRPELQQLPVMIYNGAVDAALDTAGLTTGLLLKPLADETLLTALSDLDPRLPDGSVLIVEDDPVARAMHRKLIAQHFPSYSIRDAGDGRAALAAVAARVPSLIMLDLMLPELDGFAVLEALRAERRTAAVPVLVLSGKLLTADDIRRLSEARVIFQTKDILLPGELAASLQRTMDQEERLSAHTSALVKQALVYIQQRHAEPLSRQMIADAVGVNKDYLGRIFQQELGLSPWEYLTRFRILRAKQLLRGTELTVAEVAARVGFESPTYFSQVFHREVGCSPRTFRGRRL